jgi:hypothetical protein
MVVAAVLHFNLGLYHYGLRRSEPLALAAASAPELTPAPA